MKEQFWMVWSPQGGHPRHKHDSEASAIKEACRLASENPGREFIVLQSVGEAKRVDVQFTRHEFPQPF